MRLYINDKEAFLESEFDTNMSFRFIDTYNPSAIKTSYSKTITLPNCKQNAEIFGDFKVRYPFQLFSDDGRIIEKGYCTLDSIKTVGVNKTYNITLYGGLNDFFYNLKGDEDSPKSLASLYWGDISGMNRALEDEGVFVTWNLDYVKETWINPQGMSDTFRAVPCIYDDGIMDKSLTLIPANSGLFPRTGSDPESRPFTAADGTEGILVKSLESTCYAKQDFRSDLMPLGIKYKSIIEACCNPENNGGYDVTLDPTFFNDGNPYWTNMFVLKGLPTLDYNWDVQEGEYSNFTCSLAVVGDYTVSATEASTSLVPSASKVPWDKDGEVLKLNEQYRIAGDAIPVHYSITPFIEINHNDFPTDALRRDNAYIELRSPATIKLQAINNVTGDVLDIATKTYKGGYSHTSENDWFKVLKQPYGDIFVEVDTLYQGEPMEGIAEFPSDWTEVKFRIVLSKLIYISNGCRLYYWKNSIGGGRWDSVEIPGDLKVPSSEEYRNAQLQGYVDDWAGRGMVWTTFLNKSYVNVAADYVGGIVGAKDLPFTKQELLGGTSTPFDYLTWYTKMFNLRFYVEPGTKHVSILSANNYVSQLEPLNIESKVCYDREYSKTRKIIDEGFLKFNLDPATNPTTEKYMTEISEDLFDQVFPVTIVEGKGEKEYLSNKLKIGSKSRDSSTSLNIRRANNTSNPFYGFNQRDPYTVTYDKGAGDENFNEDYSLNFDSTPNWYEFLTINGKDILNTVVMFSGNKKTEYGTPAAISRTSTDMLKIARKPCWIGGWGNMDGSILNAEYKIVNSIPHYGLVPSTTNYDNGLSYSNINYESLIVAGNMYDKFLKDFIERVYQDPVVVECYVRLNSPELRRLYWFDNSYWILTEISNYNYRDEPVKCKFIRYRYDA